MEYVNCGKYKGKKLEQVMIDDEKYIEWVHDNYWYCMTPMDKLQEKIIKFKQQCKTFNIRKKKCMSCHKKFFGGKDEAICEPCFVIMHKYDHY